MTLFDGFTMITLASRVRRHWVFAALFAAGLVLRVLTTVAYRPALLFHDSVAYLQLAEALVPGSDRVIGYPLLLRVVLTVGDLGLVPLLQHLLGLATAVLLYAALLRLGVPRWLAALGTAPVLLDAYVLQIEQMVMPEALFHVLLAAALAVLSWRRPPHPTAVAAGGLLFAAATLVRPLAQILVIPLAGFALLAGRDWSQRLRLVAAGLVAFLLPLVVYAGWYAQVHGPLRLSAQADETWYGRVAPFVDCTRLDLPAHARTLCPRLPPEQRPGPGMYVHGGESPLRAYEPPPGVSRGQVLRDFARQAILAQPLTYARAVLSDVVWVFRWDKANKPDSPAPVERWHFTLDYPEHRPDIGDVVAAHSDTPPTVVLPLARFLRGYQLSVGFTRGPVLLLGLVAGLLGAAGVGRARRSRLQAACLLWTLVPACLLLVPAAVFEFSWRYQLPGVVLYPAAAALGLTALRGQPSSAAIAASSGSVPISPAQRPATAPSASTSTKNG